MTDINLSWYLDKADAVFCHYTENHVSNLYSISNYPEHYFVVQ